MDFSSYMQQGLEINIFGEDTNQLIKTSEEVIKLVEEVKGFSHVTNGQEESDETVEITIDKNRAMRHGLTVAQIFKELSENLTTEKTATSLSMDGKKYDVILVNEDDAVDVKHLMDYEFETETKDDEGNTKKETHKLKEFATMEKGQSLASIQRDNQNTYVSVTADTEDGYNTTLLSREVEQKLATYQPPEGIRVDLAGESEEIRDAMTKMFFMIALAIILVYLIMVAQFQSLLSPFIIIFTIPLAFTGGMLGLIAAGEHLSMLSLMGFLILMGTVVNNGIVFVDYANQLRMGGMERRDALVATGKTRMRPILMTAMTTILAMSQLIFGDSMSTQLSRGMAIVIAAGLTYATLMTLIVVPVMYDIFYKKQPMNVELDDDMDDVPDDAAEFIEEIRQKRLAEEIKKLEDEGKL
jgi:multidrug efflux pump subunit AcrB